MIEVVSYTVWSTPIVLDAAADQQRRDAGAGAELVVDALGAAHAWRRDVVPLAAELVVGDDDQRVPGLRAVLDRP